jgi:hypothetical protein
MTNTTHRHEDSKVDGRKDLRVSDTAKRERCFLDWVEEVFCKLGWDYSVKSVEISIGIMGSLVLSLSVVHLARFGVCMP